LAAPELGTKQICPNCQAKFYDLNRRPAHCPKCATEFDPDEAVKSRRVRARSTPADYEAEEAEDQVKKAPGGDEEEEAEVTPEIDEAAEAEPLETDDEDGAEAAPAGDDLGVDFEEEEEAAGEDDEAVPFLEEEDDDLDEDIVIADDDADDR
jgi:uncharacterized protein (TIGR02300 family)